MTEWSAQRNEIDAALEKIDVATYLEQAGVDYVESYGTRGLQLNLNDCPVCHAGGRKTYINAETGLGNCFHGSCGFKFNRFKLVKAVSGMSGAELDAHIRSVAQDQGWMPKHKPRAIVKADLQLPSKCVALPIDGKNIAYLAHRGIKAATAGYFHLHYCNGGWWGYKTSEGEERWVKFDARVIIPVMDLDGKMVSFQGRDITGEQEPKYLFPAGYAVAGSHLYNAQNWQNGQHSHLLVGEGAFDTFAIYQAIEGVASCEAMLPTATFGMHLSEGPGGQVEKMLALKERGLRTVTFLWDSERKAMVHAIKQGLKLAGLGLTVRIARLPPGCDPNEVPASEVVSAIFGAVKLDRLSAIRLMREAVALGQSAPTAL